MYSNLRIYGTLIFTSMVQRDIPAFSNYHNRQKYYRNIFPSCSSTHFTLFALNSSANSVITSWLHCKKLHISGERQMLLFFLPVAITYIHLYLRRINSQIIFCSVVNKNYIIYIYVKMYSVNQPTMVELEEEPKLHFKINSCHLDDGILHHQLFSVQCNSSPDFTEALFYALSMLGTPTS